MKRLPRLPRDSTLVAAVIDQMGPARFPLQMALKRLIDIIGAVLGIVISAPLMAVAALAVYLEDGRPVIYRQERVGMRGRSFDLLKLRSMIVNNLTIAQTGQVDTGHPLVTRVGAILRRLKIDELPQLLNVLKGDISLVGPRPVTLEHVRVYDAFQMRRLEVRPGLTGWAQVNGNTCLTWDERIALDVYYVDHWSLARDMLILFATFSVILLGERPRPAAVRLALDHAHRSRRSG